MNCHALFVRYLAVAMLLFTAPCAIAQACRPSSQGLNFGDISNIETLDVVAAGSLDIICTAQGNRGEALRVCVSLDAGDAGNSITDRVIEERRGSTLDVQVYRDAARTQVWGSQNDAIQVDIPALQNGPNTVTVDFYGVVFGGQIPAADGTYETRFEPVATVELNSSAPCSAISGNPRSLRFDATGVVGAFCNIVASDLIFGSASDLSAGLTATSEITFVCPSAVPYAITMDGGAFTGDIGNRQMALQAVGPETISYQIYQDAARSVVWGDGAVGSALTGVGIGAVETRPVYGDIPPQTTPAAGTYFDSVTVTITF